MSSITFACVPQNTSQSSCLTPPSSPTSKNRRWKPVRRSTSKYICRSCRSRQNGFSSTAAMWLGTMSRSTPSPAPASLRNSSSPPSASEMWRGSTTSYPCCEPSRACSDGDRYRCETPRSRRYGTSSRARAKPNSGVSCSRYVARNSGIGRAFLYPAQDGDRPVLDLHVGARHEAVAVAAACRQFELPVCSEAPRRQAEADVLEVRVEQQQVRVVTDRLTALRLRSQLLAVEEDADRARVDVVPVAPRHAPAVGAHPPHVRQLYALP